MFVYSVKASSLKYIGVMVLCAGAIAASVFLMPSRSGEDIMSDAEYTAKLSTLPEKKSSDFKNISSDEDRVRFLASYGWQVSPEAIEIVEVTIPSEFDKIYTAYNELQKAEGLNLEKYRGKNVKRYTYTVENYDYESTVYANLIIYNDRVIGGDICSADVNGFIHGFTKSNKIS